jgi:hypothetical protein
MQEIFSSYYRDNLQLFDMVCNVGLPVPRISRKKLGEGLEYALS